MVTPRKKKAVAKKKAPSRLTKPSLPKTDILLYEDPILAAHPSLPSEDIIKILNRSPVEAFVFWNQSEVRWKENLKFLGETSTDHVSLYLKVEYKKESGSPTTDWIPLPPFTNSYYLKFPEPIFDLQVTLCVEKQGKFSPSLHVASGDLPPNKEQSIFDSEWIHPTWERLGLSERLTSGSFKNQNSGSTLIEKESPSNLSFSSISLQMPKGGTEIT